MTTTKTASDNILRVKMFGSFSLEYNGKSLAGGKKQGETQFGTLMQLLLHFRADGVRRELLEEVLFGDRDIDNVHHALQSVVYNAKKRLTSFGLPQDCIYMASGVFYWSPAVPVVEDAAEFDKMYRQAQQTTDPDERLALYVDACNFYTGEFLSLYANVMWAARESRRYAAQFTACMEKAVDGLRHQQDYFQMEALGVHASLVAPFSDWETVTMEALVSLGRYEEANKLYADTVDLYFREQGLRPSKKLMSSLELLSSHMDHTYALLDDIQNGLDEHDTERGGYYCSYPVFRGIYHMLQRMMERGGQSVYLMLCTVVDSKGSPMRDGAILDEMGPRLGDAICRSVRHSDAVNKYGKGQFLVLLVNTTLENCGVVQKRINENFIRGRQRTGIEYRINCVVCSDI